MIQNSIVIKYLEILANRVLLAPKVKSSLSTAKIPAVVLRGVVPGLMRKPSSFAVTPKIVPIHIVDRAVKFTRESEEESGGGNTGFWGNSVLKRLHVESYVLWYSYRYIKKKKGQYLAGDTTHLHFRNGASRASRDTPSARRYIMNIPCTYSISYRRPGSTFKPGEHGGSQRQEGVCVLLF
jgi:hypothetical protein